MVALATASAEALLLENEERETFARLLLARRRDDVERTHKYALALASAQARAILDAIPMHANDHAADVIVNQGDVRMALPFGIEIQKMRAACHEIKMPSLRVVPIQVIHDLVRQEDMQRLAVVDIQDVRLSLVAEQS